MANSDTGLTIDTSGVARYNGIRLIADQPFPGSRVRPDRTPNTVIKVLGRDLPYIEARLHTLQRPWQWVSYYTKTDLFEMRSCSIRIVAEGSFIHSEKRLRESERSAFLMFFSFYPIYLSSCPLFFFFKKTWHRLWIWLSPVWRGRKVNV
jgi:hypothetical protein